MNESTLPYALSLGVIGVLVLVSLAVIRLQAEAPTTSLSVNNVAPTITAVKLCSGTGNPGGCTHVSSVTLTGGTTTSYSIAGTLEDANGFSDISLLVGRFRRNEVSPACTFNENNCYLATTAALDCTLSSTSSTAGTYECPIDVEYYADATDDASQTSEGAYPSDNWVTVVYAQDESAAESNTLTANSEIISLRDIAACAAIDYGTLANGASSASGVNCQITNDGNVDVDIEISTPGMACTFPNTASDIPAGNQRVDINNLSYASMGNTATFRNYTTSPTTNDELSLNKRTTTVVSDDLYHTITVPYGVSGSCSGTNTISAVAEV